MDEAKHSCCGGGAFAAHHVTGRHTHPCTVDVQGNISVLEKHFQEFATFRDMVEQHTLQGEWEGARQYTQTIDASVQAAHADLQAGHAMLKSYKGSMTASKEAPKAMAPKVEPKDEQNSQNE